MDFAHQALAIYAAVHGYLARVAVTRVGEFEQKFLAYVEAQYPEVLTSILESKNLVEQTEAHLKEALTKFTETHPDLFAK